MKSATTGISRTTSPPTNEDPAEQQSDDGAADHRALIAAAPAGAAEMQRPRDERAERPHAGQRHRPPEEGRVAGMLLQRQTQRRSAQHQHDRDDDPPTAHSRRRFVMRHSDIDDAAADLLQSGGRAGRVSHCAAPPHRFALHRRWRGPSRRPSLSASSCIRHRCTFGVSVIRMSSPVRNTPAIGPGTTLTKPRPGCAIDGVTMHASRRSRSASPPAQAGSLSARWCGSARALTGRGRWFDSARLMASSIDNSPSGGSGTRSRRPLPLACIG